MRCPTCGEDVPTREYPGWVGLRVGRHVCRASIARAVELYQQQLEHAAKIEAEGFVEFDVRVPWDQNANADRVRHEFWEDITADWLSYESLKLTRGTDR